MIRLLAVDMDGTCLNRKNQISEQNMAALRRLAQSGIQIVPASGRGCTCLPHQLRAAPLLFRYAITSNGARVDDVRGHCLFCQEIYPDTALSLLSDCQTLRIGVSAHISREYLLQGRLLQMMGTLCARSPPAHQTEPRRGRASVLFFQPDSQRSAAADPLLLSHAECRLLFFLCGNLFRRGIEGQGALSPCPAPSSRSFPDCLHRRQRE